MSILWKKAYKPNVRSWGHCGCVTQAKIRARKQAKKEATEKRWAKIENDNKKRMSNTGSTNRKVLPKSPKPSSKPQKSSHSTSSRPISAEERAKNRALLRTENQRQSEEFVYNANRF